MCRLLGYATAGFNLSLNAVLGQGNVEDFRELSEIHNDGWGVAQLADPASAPYVRDGGAPTPETGTKIYKSTIAARAIARLKLWLASRLAAPFGICVWPAPICRSLWRTSTRSMPTV